MTATHKTTPDGRYSLIRDYKGHMGIIEINDGNARWIVRPDALLFDDEVTDIWNRITEKEQPA